MLIKVKYRLSLGMVSAACWTMLVSPLLAQPAAALYNELVEQADRTLAPVPVAMTNETLPTTPSTINTTLGILKVKEMEIRDVLERISSQSGLNIVVDQEEITARVTIFLENINVFDALRIILDTNQLAYAKEDTIVHVMTAATFASRYGLTFNQKLQARIIPLTHAQPQVVGALLDKMKSVNGKVIYSEWIQSFILLEAPETLQSMEELIQRLDIAVTSKTFTLRYLKGREMAQRIQGFLTENVGRSELGDQEDQIILVDTTSRIAEIAQRIEELDQPATEIVHEVKILQVILTDEYRKGVDWEAIVSDYQSIKFPGFEAGEAGICSVGTVNEEDYVVLLDALEVVGTINTISNLAVTATDHDPIEIIVRLSDLLTDFERTEMRNGAVAEKDVIYRVASRAQGEYGIILDIQPQVVEHLSVANLVSGETVEKRTVTLKIENGTTVVIGGLFKEMTQEATRKIPLLGDLPFLGFAFRMHGQRSSETEIIVFLTPKVIVRK